MKRPAVLCHDCRTPLTKENRTSGDTVTVRRSQHPICDKCSERRWKAFMAKPD